MTTPVVNLVAAAVTIAGSITIISTTNFPQIDFNSDGTITYKSNGIAGLYYTRGWYQAANVFTPVTGIGSRFQIRLTPSVGSFGLELTSTWVALGTSWNRTSGNGTSTGLIEIRDAVKQVVVASVTLNLTDV